MYLGITLNTENATNVEDPQDKVLKYANKTLPNVNRTMSGLSKYQGEWTYESAAHLLRRALFGPKQSEIETSITLGLDGTIAALLDLTEPIPSGPVNYLVQTDPNVPLGEIWVDAPKVIGKEAQRRNSLSAWRVGLMIHQNFSLREKMTLFWQNHFAMENTLSGDARWSYQFIELVMKSYAGNFRQMVKDVTVNPAILVYLNGNTNQAKAPNENFARELFELFTIGKGPVDGDGSYTYYTEEDIQAASKVLTGWRTSVADNAAYFQSNRHDTTSKTFSSKFDNVVIDDAQESEYQLLVEVIFQQERTSEYICEKLYRFFIYYLIDEQVMANVIKPMAQILRDNDFEIRPVLVALFSSQHFFDQINRGALIKTPLDFLIGILRQVPNDAPQDIDYNSSYRFWKLIQNAASDQQQDIGNLPNVAGWPAYYQAPLYHQSWINSVTLPLRDKVKNYYFRNNGIPAGDLKIKLNALGILNEISVPSDPNTLISEISKWLFPIAIEDAQKDYLKSILIPGLPDFEWTVEYNYYKDNPADEAAAKSIQDKLTLLLTTIFSFAEYHLS